MNRIILSLVLVAGVLPATGSVETPENLKLTPWSDSSFTAAAKGVDAARAYAFERTRYAGGGRTERREDFAVAPALGDGWTFETTNNVCLSSYDGESSSFVDKKSSSDRRALKVEDVDAGAAVCVEILSPEVPADEFIVSCSYWSKRVSGSPSTDALRVFGRTADSETWIALSEPYVLTTSQDRQTVEIGAEGRIRRVKFVLTAEAGSFQNCALDSFSVVSRSDRVRAEVVTVTNAAPSVLFSDLAKACYGCRVKALGATVEEDSPWSEEQVIDLASGLFRTVGPVSLAKVRGAYAQDFNTLVTLEKETDAACVPLDDWQFLKGTDPVATVRYASGTSSTASGVYCFSDALRATNSFMLGTLASGDFGYAIGLSFTNDTEFALAAPTVTFTSVQRTFKKNPATYVLEWRVTDGDWSIGVEAGDWRPLTIPETAPFTTETAEGRSEYRQEAIAVRPDFAAAGLPGAGLRPGAVLVIRWRHAKIGSGPMMALDDVRVDFQIPKKGFGIVFR